MDMIIIAVAVLGGLGVIGAIALYMVSRRFHVDEDPRVAIIEDLLPGANCGGCGRSGCHDFATACATATSLENLNCPGAGSEVMKKIASIVGLAAGTAVPRVAVVKCAGACDLRPRAAVYDGAKTCAVAASVAAGESACPDGCLGCGDCVASCRWNALSIDPETGLPVVDTDRCTGCEACVRACPRHVIEIRPKGPRGMRVWVACNNHDRGPEAMKACQVSCIACGKCAKECTHDAITIDRNLAYIDPDKCRLCHKCVDACPRKSIHAENFPVKKSVAVEA